MSTVQAMPTMGTKVLVTTRFEEEDQENMHHCLLRGLRDMEAVVESKRDVKVNV